MFEDCKTAKEVLSALRLSMVGSNSVEYTQTIVTKKLLYPLHGLGLKFGESCESPGPCCKRFACD